MKTSTFTGIFERTENSPESMDELEAFFKNTNERMRRQRNLKFRIQKIEACAMEVINGNAPRTKAAHKFRLSENYDDHIKQAHRVLKRTEELKDAIADKEPSGIIATIAMDLQQDYMSLLLKLDIEPKLKKHIDAPSSGSKARTRIYNPIKEAIAYENSKITRKDLPRTARAKTIHKAINKKDASKYKDNDWDLDEGKIYWHLRTLEDK